MMTPKITARKKYNRISPWLLAYAVIKTRSAANNQNTMSSIDAAKAFVFRAFLLSLNRSYKNPAAIPLPAALKKTYNS